MHRGHPRLHAETRHFGVQARMRKMITKNEFQERLIRAICYCFLSNLVEKVNAEKIQKHQVRVH
jgi:hypothetical protein